MYSVPPRPNTTQEFRMVRRARTFSLEGDPVQWVNESIVMRADALDNQTHTPCESAQQRAVAAVLSDADRSVAAYRAPTGAADGLL